MNCTTARQAALLLLYGEISDAERAAAQGHVEGCDACRLALAEERRLLAILSERQGIEPDEALLERCRMDLARALDERPAPGAEWAQRILGFWSQARLTPAYGVLFLVVGFMAGAIVPRAEALRAARPEPQAQTGASPAVSETPLGSIRSLEAAPDGDHVRLSYDALQRGSLEGSAADPEIRSLLLSTLEDSQNPGLRLAAIEALRRHVDQEEVRRALLAAMRADENAGARLKAIEALDQRVPSDPEIRRAMLDAVRQDANPGVRVRAIDLLSRASDPQLLPEMERLSREDPDTYVRMRSGDFVDAMYARNSQ
jgi:hypothetical protein